MFAGGLIQIRVLSAAFAAAAVSAKLPDAAAFAMEANVAPSVTVLILVTISEPQLYAIFSYFA